MFSLFYCSVESMSLHNNKHLPECLAWQKLWPKSISNISFKCKKPRINNGVINNVFKDALFFQHLNMAGRHLLQYLFCFFFRDFLSLLFLEFFFIRNSFYFARLFLAREEEGRGGGYQKYLCELLGYSSLRDCKS